MTNPVIETDDDGIPHGIKGYRSPYNCKGDICKRAWADYIAGRRAARKADGTDQLAKKRAQKRAGAKRPRSTVRTESRDSDKPPKIGEMELAVITECASLETPPKATQLVAAKQLASLIDKLSTNGDGVGAAVINSSTKQLMSIMAEIRGDTTNSKATGRRKSGGRLATVGALTKVKRQGA